MTETAYDFIIVGAGSAGAALAGRLTESGRHRVLLIEAGRAGHPLTRLPVSFGLLIDHPGVNWRYASSPEPGTGNRAIPVPRGKILGGSSAINGLVYVRGQRLDYDIWAQMGNRGWSWQDVAPVFRRMEGAIGNGSHPDDERGTDGPLTVTEVSDRNRLYEALFQAAGQIGIPRARDYNGAGQEGIARAQTTIHRGRRMSTAKAYLAPARRRRNLHIITEAQVTGLLLDGRRVTGVTYRRNGAGHGDSVEARAGREVILSAGAVASPQLLELSGIGRPDILKACGLPVRHASPAVGENLRDHITARGQWRLAMPGVSYNERTHGLGLAGQVLRYLAGGGGFLGLPAAPVLAFVKTRRELATPDIQLSLIPWAVEDPKRRKLFRFPAMAIACYQLRPESLGSVHVTAPDPAVPPAIRFNFLADATDRDTLVDGVAIMRRLMTAPAMAAFAGAEFAPGDEVAGRDAILDWVRATAETAYHPVGTCRMGPDAVVDSRLRVRGLSGLRIADASIFPTMPSGNTNAPSIMVGEKCADLILADL